MRVAEPARRFRGTLRELTAPQLFVGSFLLLIAAGTIGFKILPGLYTGSELSWLDALFTATSDETLLILDLGIFGSPVTCTLHKKGEGSSPPTSMKAT